MQRKSVHVVCMHACVCVFGKKGSWVFASTALVDVCMAGHVSDQFLWTTFAIL